MLPKPDLAATQPQPGLTESQSRLYEKLYRDLGDEIIAFLQDETINEIMLNPDGSVWVDSSVKGQRYTGKLSRAEGLAIIHDIAGIQQCVVTHQSPYLEAELPFYRALKSERFTAQVPPIVLGPSFTIRKKSNVLFTLDDYVASQRLTLEQATLLRKLIRARKNILVCGGPGSGKTTVTNALIREAVLHDATQRFVILEDLPELRCEAPNSVSMLTSHSMTMTDLLRLAMRMRPDRILIGEVRGREALDLLKAWNTGCPGGIATVHANGAMEAIQRITDLAMEAGLNFPPTSLIQQTIDIIISVVKKSNQKGFVSEIFKVGGAANGAFQKLA